MSETKIQSRLIPLTDWSKHHLWPTTSALRYLAFHADKNGFNKVIRRVSGRVLLDEQAFFLWVEESNTKGGKI